MSVKGSRKIRIPGRLCGWRLSLPQAAFGTYVFALLQSGSEGTLSWGERIRTEDRASEAKGGRYKERGTRVSRIISERPLQSVQRTFVSAVNVHIRAPAGLPAALPPAGASFQQLGSLFEGET